MKGNQEIITLADTIIWLAQDWQKDPQLKCQNINSAIHAIKVLIANELMIFMKENKK